MDVMGTTMSDRLAPRFLTMDLKIYKKIDSAVATIMALDRATRCGNNTTESVYDSRGLLFV